MSDFDTNLFDTNLMAWNTSPFAAYLEPDGYANIKERKAMKDEDYVRFVPQTHRIAHALFHSLTQTDCWGKQVFKKKTTDSETGGWVQETHRRSAAGRGGIPRPGRALKPADVLKSLARPAYFALGRTDMHLETEEHLYRPLSFSSTRVNCLCQDVDMDDAWASGDMGAARHEVWRESQIALAMGLPYRAFATGGRGHQCVLPLPSFVDRSVASWLLAAFVSILQPWQERDGGAVADVSNLEKIVRIAGGRHIKTGRLAAWIDPVAGRLHDLLVQAELMASGYSSPETDPLRRSFFRDAADEVADYLLHQHIVPRYQCLPTLREERILARTLRDLPENWLVESVLTAQERYGLADDTSAILVKPDALPNATQRREASELSQMPPESLIVWANRVWDIHWGEGTYWNWIREGGERGITAAKILFGSDALPQLLARADKAPHTTPGEPAEWKRSIRALYGKHKMQSLESADALRLAHGTLSGEGQALIPIIMDALHAKNRILNRNLADVERLISLLLVAFQDSKEGFVDISIDTLHAALRIKHPDSVMSRSTLQRHLLRLRDDKPECGYALFTEIILDRSGQNQAARYRPGDALRATAFGFSLVRDNCSDYIPQNKPTRMRVHSLRGLEWQEKTPKPRGRKRKQTQQQQGQ